MSRTLAEITRERDELRSKRDALQQEADGFIHRANEEDRKLKPGEAERSVRLKQGQWKLDKQLEALDEEYRAALLAFAESHPENLEHVDPPAAETRAQDPARNQWESRALGTIERHRRSLSAPAGDRLERLVRENDQRGIGARYLAAVGNPAYDTAFGKILHDPNFGHLRFTSAEVAAVQSVTAVTEERALSLTGSAGGFAVPFELDPSIMLTGTGAIDPLRQISTVRTVATDEWRGVTSTGITAGYAAEATETTDNAPTLVQPTISTEKAQAFVPFSIEIGMDWESMRRDLAEALEDAKTTLEATKFVSGSGTNEPAGVITGATNTVNATTGQTVDAEDVYRLQEALPARYQARARFVANGTIINTVYRLVGGGSTEPVLISEDRTRMLGKPLHEASAMATSPATGNKFLLLGDFSRFVIVDRIGLSIELVPHLFGANQRPTGQRGLYAFWRNGSKVVDANAFRVLIGIA